jgi:hypothetical protein
MKRFTVNAAALIESARVGGGLFAYQPHSHDALHDGRVAELAPVEAIARE